MRTIEANIFIPEEIPAMNKGEEAIIRGILSGLYESGIIPMVTVFTHLPHIDIIRYPDIHFVTSMSFRPYNHFGYRRHFELLYIWFMHFLFAIIYRTIGKASLRFFRADIWHAYDKADLILVGHDGAFSDINLLFAVFVKMLRKKQVVFGMGFRGFRSFVARKTARFIMPLFDLIVLREYTTLARLKAVGVPEGRVHVKPDPAFLLKPASDEKLATLLRNEGLQNINGPLIGIVSVKGSVIFDNCFSKVKNRETKYDLHKQLFCTLVTHIIHITGGSVIFIPHCIGYGPERDDRLVAIDIRKTVPVDIRDKVIAIENEYDGPTLKRFIEVLDFLVAERTHALIGACSVGTPFLAITVSQDTRTHGIIGDVFGMPDLIIDINDPDTELIVSRFAEAWARRDQIKTSLLTKAKVLHRDGLAAAKMLAEIIRR